MDSYLKDLGKWKQTRFTGEAQDSEAPGSLEAEDFSTSQTSKEFQKLQDKLSLRANDREQ